MIKHLFFLILFLMGLSNITLFSQIKYFEDSVKTKVYSEKFCKKNRLADSIAMKLVEILNYHVAINKKINAEFKKSSTANGNTVKIRLNSSNITAINQEQTAFEERLEKLLGKKMLTKFERFLYDERMIRQKEIMKKHSM